MTSTSPEIYLRPAWALFSALGRFVFRFRNQLTAVVAVLILWLTRPLPFFGTEEADSWSDLAGVLVAGVNTGSVDRAHPFDPDEQPLMPHSYTVMLAP